MANTGMLGNLVEEERAIGLHEGGRKHSRNAMPHVVSFAVGYAFVFITWSIPSSHLSKANDLSIRATYRVSIINRSDCRMRIVFFYNVFAVAIVLWVMGEKREHCEQRVSCVRLEPSLDKNEGATLT